MLRIGIVALLLGFFHVDHVWAQNSVEAMKFANTITMDELKHHLYIISSDEYEGRETGKAGQKKAAAYIADYYKSLGIEPVVNGSYFQQYPLVKRKISNTTMDVGDHNFQFIKDFYSVSDFGKEEIDLGNMVFAGYGIETPTYSDYSRLDVKGKAVICFLGEPTDKSGNSRITGKPEPSDWTQDFRYKIDLAKAKGATAVLFVRQDYASAIARMRYWMENPGLDLDYPDEKQEDLLPFFMVTPELANAILANGKQKPATRLKQRIDMKGKPSSKSFACSAIIHVKRESEKVSAENVLGFIEGSDSLLKNEIVVISAHYDHIGIVKGEINNGADDDGSGTVSTLEIAQAFMEAKKAGFGPRRSILILNVSGEEKGLLGSEWYSEFPVFPLENTVCDLNIDMIGRMDEQHEGNPNYVYLIGSDKLSTDLHKISEACNATYAGLQLDYTYNEPNDPNRFYYRSDHYNFAKHNIPVIFYFSGVHEDYHKPGDDPEKILYEKMTTIARLVFHTAWNVANRDERLNVDVENNFSNE